MRKKKSLTLDQPIVDAGEYETPMSDDMPDDLQEEFPEPEPAIEIKPIVVKPPVEVKIAVTAAVADCYTSARALKTGKKFVGKWVNLKQGKILTETKEVIAHLRAHGLVE
jgi:hypothetical protein